MNKQKRFPKGILYLAAAVVMIAAAVVFFAAGKAPVCLVLRDAETGKRIAAFTLPEDGSFSVRFVHSVNKSPVQEFYEARDTDLYVTGCVYESLGAGVETAAGEGEQMRIDPDGTLRYTGVERQVDPLIYIVGTRSDHELIIGDTAVSLTALCGKNAAVRFSAERTRRGKDASVYADASAREQEG